jgi:type IV pilus assembly protein PilY1
VIHYESYDVIYAGANDGMLHAFKDSKGTTGDDGTELWGFIPPDLLGNLKNFGSSLAPMQIFVDGSPKYYRNDDGSIILIFGERRGGNRYYALDVTDPLDPQFKWSISPTEIILGTVTNPTTAYQELGQSWSTPKFGKIKNGAGTKVVAFIGGGYDNTQPTSAEDKTPAGTDTSGRAVYVVDIANGNRIWSYSNMTYCVPGDITTIDSLGALSGDGLIDRLYVGNVGGEIWRFDLCSSTTGACVPDMSNTGNWTGKRIFTGSGKIFYPPDVSFENSRSGACNTMAFSGTYNMLFFGTGDREKPNDQSSGNRLYAVKDYDILPNPFTTIPESCLTDVTSYGTSLATLQSSMGWYIRLNRTNGTNPNPGEKSTGQAVALGGAVYYTTFTPTSETSACTIGTGSGNIYVLQYQTGMAFFDLDGNLVNEPKDRSINVVAGLPSGIIVAVINGSSVNLYGGVPDGVIPPKSSIENPIVPIDWRILF